MSNEDIKQDDSTAINVDDYGVGHMLTVMTLLQDFPKEIREAFDDIVAQACLTQLPMLVELHRAGSELDRNDITPLADIFAMAVERLSGTDGIGLTATLHDIAGTLAKELDSGINRVLLQAKKVDRRALRDITYCHARLTAALTRLSEHAEKQSGV